MPTLLEMTMGALQKLIGKRLFLEILLFLLGASAIAFISTHGATHTQILWVGAWVCIACWYFWLSHRMKISRRVSRLLLAIALIATVGFTATSFGIRFMPVWQISASMTSGKDFERKGMLKQASKSYLNAVDAAQTKAELPLKAQALCAAGHVEIVLTQLADAENHYTACRELAVTLGDAMEQGESQTGLAKIAWVQGELDLARQQLDEALVNFKEDCTTSETFRCNLDEAETHLLLGQIDRSDGHPDSAVKQFDTASDLYQKVGDLKGYGNLLIARGQLYRSEDDYEDAEKNYLSAEDNFEKAGDILGKANGFLLLGEVEFALNNPETARDYYKKARGIYQETGSRLGEGNVLITMGDMRLEEDDYDAAQDCYKEALQKFEGENLLLGMGAATASLGKVSDARGAFDEAHERFGKARQIFQSAQNLRGEASTDLYDGDALKHLGRNDDAIKSLKQAEALYRRIGSRNQADEAAQLAQELSHAPTPRLAAILNSK
jgi:tetratricopeptide (TPR) repeat protein